MLGSSRTSTKTKGQIAGQRPSWRPYLTCKRKDQVYNVVKTGTWNNITVAIELWITSWGWRSTLKGDRDEKFLEVSFCVKCPSQGGNHCGQGVKKPKVWIKQVPLTCYLRSLSWTMVGTSVVSEPWHQALSVLRKGGWYFKFPQLKGRKE